VKQTNENYLQSCKLRETIGRGLATTASNRSKLLQSVVTGWLAFTVLLSAIGAGCGTSTSNISQPGNINVQLWVADTQNNRVLGYQAPPKNGDPAAVVLGQITFGPTACNSGGLSGATLCTPFGATIDASNSLWVADTGNNRVLKFVPPFRNSAQAILVIGQPSFVASGSCAPELGSTCGPRSLAFDRQGNLWVSDANSNRVVEYVPPFSTGMPATLVLGQADFTSSVCSEASPTGMCSPSGLAFDSVGDLFVSDMQNSRVIMFKPPFGIGMAATLAVGQLSLTSNARFVTSQFSVSNPSGIFVDESGNLYVADSDNSRIMIFPPPTVSGEYAAFVLGNDDFRTINPNACGPGTNGAGPSINGGTICHPLDVKVDGAGNVAVADQNNRTLIFAPPITTGKFASVVLGQLSLTSDVPPTGLATSQNAPRGLAVSGII
jgi:NHL repeat-containing protein